MELTKTQYEALKSNGIESVETIEENSFSEACYNGNCYEDLENYETAIADSVDMKQWGISEEDWRESQKTALQYAMYWYEDEM